MPSWCSFLVKAYPASRLAKPSRPRLEPQKPPALLTLFQHFPTMISAWSMRSWESAHLPEMVGRGSDSQDRMDQDAMIAGFG